MKKEKAKNAKIEKFMKGLDSLTLRILGYQEKDGDWAAHCLEMDLIGYGNSFEVACEKLIELIDDQLGFAIFKEQATLIYHPAPARLFQLYEMLVQSRLQHFASKNRELNKEHRIANYTLPSDPTKFEPTFVSC